jgi:hypothetical protein
MRAKSTPSAAREFEGQMSGKSDNQSSSQLARTHRLRLAAEEGARAMEEAATQAIAVRQKSGRVQLGSFRGLP